jgi:MSHA biogenesis protein MshL
MKLLRYLLTTACLVGLCGLACGQDSAEPRFDVRVEDAPARAFFEGLADGTPKNMLVHPDVKGRVTVHLKQVTLEEALDAVRDLYGYDYRPVARGYMVLPASLQTRMFHLNYLDLERLGTSKTRVSSGQITQGGNTSYGASASGGTGEGTTEVTGTSVLTRNGSNFWTGIEADLKVIVGASEGGASSVVINRQSGVIVVRAMPTELRDVADYLQRTQSTVTRQVVLEAKIVEVELSSAYQAGINWATVLTDGNNQFLLGQATPPGGFDRNPLTPPGGSTTVAPGNPLTGFVTDILGGAFTIAADTPDFNAFIELLGTQGRTHVLSSPRVSTLHNQKAVIKAGSDEFFVTGIDSDTTTGTATTTSVKVELTPFFSGVALDVTPQISEDGGVLLHIHPTVSDVTDQNKQVSFSGSTSNLPLALSQIRESDSVVKARNGQVIVIGGLMRETRKRDAYKTPWLGDVPGLGRLFRSERDQARTVELVILLRPIVAQDADWPQMVREPQDRIDALRRKGQLDAKAP